MHFSSRQIAVLPSLLCLHFVSLCPSLACLSWCIPVTYMHTASLAFQHPSFKLCHDWLCLLNSAIIDYALQMLP